VENKNCPFCGEEILATAQKCKHCSEWLDKTSTVAQKRIMPCPICGEDIEEDLEICPQCKEPIRNKQEKLSKVSDLKQKSGMKVTKIMSIIGLAWFGLLLIALFSLDGYDEEEALGVGLFVILYAIPFSIVGLLQFKKNKLMKIMSIIGLAWNGLWSIVMISTADELDYDTAVGFCVFLLLFAIPYSIVGLIQSMKK
jgi:predicted nucleic acid-binding Zn ribbon protein